jgi:hypothetical protein
MAQVQSQLDVLRIQLSKIMKGNEKHKHVSCITCKTEGHRKEECPKFTQYMAIEAPNPLI